MSQVIIGIHGLGNKPPEKLLQRWWKKAIIEGLVRLNKPSGGINFELVYWADILYPKPLHLSVKDKTDPLFLDEPYKSQPVPSLNTVPSNHIFTKIFNFFERQLDHVFLNKDMSLKFQGLTETIIKRYFKDLEIYYSENRISQGKQKRPIREVIQERLMNTLLKHKDKDIMLIGHSMGSIIAYDVLMNLKNDIRINTLVTIGSPLGLPVIVSRIFKEIKAKNKALKRLHTPENVDYHWYNLSDKDDNVAMDHTLADDYGSNTNNVRAFDISVYNDYINNNERNPHKIYGYLRTGDMARIIFHFLTERRKSKLVANYLSIKTWLYQKAGRLKNRFI